jgi:hypothetical protein
VSKVKALIALIKKDFPDFEVIDKKQSTLMLMLSKVLFFNKKFMTHYTTTVGNKIYVPDLSFLDDDDNAFTVLAHEYVHMCDNKRLGPLFKLLYLSPQIFALLSVFAFWNIAWLWCLLFLLPLPSPGRTWFEYRGYSMSMACYYFMYGVKPEVKWYLDYFSTSLYYWMCPFREYLAGKLDKSLDDIVNNRLTVEQTKVKELLDERKQRFDSLLV